MKLIDYLKNPAMSAKALAAFLMAVQPFLKAVGIDLPGWLNETWLTALLTAGLPLVVWLVPNKQAGNGGTARCSSLALVAALALALGLAGCAADATTASPRERALPALLGYGAVLTAADAAIQSGQLSGKQLHDLQAATRAATDAVVAYAQAARLCIRDQATGAIVDAPSNPPGQHCDPSGAAQLASAAQALIGHARALLTLLGFPPAS